MNSLLALVAALMLSIAAASTAVAASDAAAVESLVKVGSDKGRFSEEEEDATAVALPVSVASPIVVSRESKEGIGGLSKDKMLESDILVQSGVTAYSWVGAGGGEPSSPDLCFAADLRFAFLLAR